MPIIRTLEYVREREREFMNSFHRDVISDINKKKGKKERDIRQDGA